MNRQALNEHIAKHFAKRHGATISIDTSKNGWGAEVYADVAFESGAAVKLYQREDGSFYNQKLRWPMKARNAWAVKQALTSKGE